MKWYKHMTNAMDDLFIKDLEEKFGDTGYAFWFKTLELIGAQGTGGVLDISVMNWRRVIHSRRTDHLRRLYTFATERAKLQVEDLGNGMFRVTCPKYKEIADWYTSYGKSNKQVQSDSKDATNTPPIEEEGEVEEEVEEKKKKKKIGGKVKQPPKTAFGAHVFLTMDEYANLLKDLGSEARRKWCIEKLDNYLGQNERNLRKYTSHYRAILSWVKEALEAHEARKNIPGNREETREDKLRRLNQAT